MSGYKKLVMQTWRQSSHPSIPLLLVQSKSIASFFDFPTQDLMERLKDLTKLILDPNDRHPDASFPGMGHDVQHHDTPVVHDVQVVAGVGNELRVLLQEQDHMASRALLEVDKLRWILDRLSTDSTLAEQGQQRLDGKETPTSEESVSAAAAAARVAELEKDLGVAMKQVCVINTQTVTSCVLKECPMCVLLSAKAEVMR